VFLYRRYGFTTAGESLDLLESVYPGPAVAPKVQYLPKRSLTASLTAEHRPHWIMSGRTGYAILTRSASRTGGRLSPAMRKGPP
jgi:hypothetical protein